MSIEKTRAKVITSIWKAIAQSGVNLSSVSQEQQDDMVNKIADTVMKTIDFLMDEEIDEKLSDAEIDEHDEQFIWKGRPFLSLVETYLITSERLKIIKGMLSRDIENFELIRIQDIDYKQGVTERIFGIGDLTIRGHDASDPEIILRNIAKPEDVYEILRKAWLDARKRYGMEFREFM